MKLGLRQATPHDKRFMQQLYHTSRDFELLHLQHWPTEMQQTFLNEQFEAQYRGYRQTFPEAIWLIVEMAGNAIGRLIVDHRKHEVSLMDICLLRAWRGKGIGTQLVQAVVQEGERQQQPTRLYISRMNLGAFQLYSRLGFVVIEELDVHLHMEHPAQEGTLVEDHLIENAHLISPHGHQHPILTV